VTLEFANGAYGVIHVTALCYEDTPFGQTHHMEFHGSGGTLYSYTDWDTVQQVKGARVGEGLPRELPIPDHIWGKSRRDTVHNTYRDMFRKEDFMIRQFINGILDDTELRPNLDDGARIQKLIDAALLSHKTGQRIEV
jgi:predicted dehydrogenase